MNEEKIVQDVLNEFAKKFKNPYNGWKPHSWYSIEKCEWKEGDLDNLVSLAVRKGYEAAFSEKAGKNGSLRSLKEKDEADAIEISLLKGMVLKERRKTLKDVFEELEKYIGCDKDHICYIDEDSFYEVKKEFLATEKEAKKK